MTAKQIAERELCKLRRDWWQQKLGWRRSNLAHYKAQGDRAHYWLDQNEKKHNAKGVASDKKQIEKLRPIIAKWQNYVYEAEHQVAKYNRRISELTPKLRTYGMGGFVPPGTPYRWQRSDQGQDFEIPLGHAIVAPGDGEVLEYAADRPFPSGFGNPYAIVKFYNGPFAVWPAAYLGHANEPLVRPGQKFKRGQPLARLNHFLNPGWGWVEVGRWSGGPGGMGEGAQWRHLFAPRQEP